MSANPFRSPSRDHLPSIEHFTTDCFGGDAFERLKTSRLGMTPMAAPSPKPWNAGGSHRFGGGPSSTPFASPIPNRSGGSDDPHALDAILSSPAVKRTHATGQVGTPLPTTQANNISSNEDTGDPADFSFVDMSLSFSEPNKNKAQGPFITHVSQLPHPSTERNMQHITPTTTNEEHKAHQSVPSPSPPPIPNQTATQQAWYDAIVSEITKRVIHQISSYQTDIRKSEELGRHAHYPHHHHQKMSDKLQKGKSSPPTIRPQYPLPSRHTMQYLTKPRDTRYDLIVSEEDVAGVHASRDGGGASVTGMFSYYRPDLFALRSSLRSQQLESLVVTGLRYEHLVAPISLNATDEMSVFMGKRHSTVSDVLYDPY